MAQLMMPPVRHFALQADVDRSAVPAWCRTIRVRVSASDGREWVGDAHAVADAPAAGYCLTCGQALGEQAAHVQCRGEA